MTTKADISRWFDKAVSDGATHMLVVCDTYDYEDYPVSVFPGQDPHKLVAEFCVNMQRVMEVYNLSMPKTQQINQHRCWNY